MTSGRRAAQLDEKSFGSAPRSATPQASAPLRMRRFSSRAKIGPEPGSRIPVPISRANQLPRSSPLG
ncbi:hypothetical protein A5739_09795 [Mycobacterium colombiense]|nr:hypothetical protein A5739_09795 [Mycobacterium colombiense]